MKRVLVVDDSREILDVIKVVLEESGFEVACLDSGGNIKTIVLDYDPDVILLDIMLVHHDGRELCEQLKKDPETKDFPVILISASHNLSSSPSSADDYVSKPFDIDDLVRKVKKFADR